MEQKQILTNFLNIHWIRPEVAIWRTLDVLHMKKIQFKRPMIDLGCGDGTFSFTNFGGSLDYSFDVFRTMKNTSGFVKGKDIHDQKFSGDFKITKKPKARIDVGLDWKKNLLKKAQNLSLYEKTIKHNLNNTLPVSDKAFETVFSNVFYWIKNIKQLLRESKRILFDSGQIIILVPDKNLEKNLIYYQYIKHGFKWAEILDHGIYQNITNHCYTFAQWKKLFAEEGLKIQTHESYLSNNFIKLWSIGLRPYSPYIIEMANKLQSKDRLNVKKRWIKETVPLLNSFIEYELTNKEPKCFHLFSLKKK